MDKEAKERAIAEVYYHERHGFGSIQHTLTKAREKYPGITREEVKAFLDKQEIKQRRKPLKVNSFVADLPRQEFQVDLADFGQEAKPRYCFVAIDIFTKKLFTKPLQAKSDAYKALPEMYRELGYPSSIMSDEGGEFRGAFGENLKENLVEQLFSRTGGRFVERVIRTLKMKLHLRTETFTGSWQRFLQNVVDQYNDAVHSATGETPDHVAENEYDPDVLMDVHDKLTARAKFSVKHPPIAVGDFVKIRVKPSGYGDYKETFNSWSVKVYKIESIEAEADGGAKYTLEGYSRALLRYELKKVEDVQRPNLQGRQIVANGRAVHSRLPGAPPPPRRGPPPPRPPPGPPPASGGGINAALMAGNPVHAQRALRSAKGPETYGRATFGGSSGSGGANPRPQDRPVSAPATVGAPKKTTKRLTAFEEAQKFLNTPYFGHSTMDASGNLKRSF